MPQKNEKPKVDFIGVGHERSGTTWISECLKEHPDICLSEPKETGFFNHDELYNKGLGYYTTFFNHCGSEKIQGEFTPDYCYHPEVAERIHKHYPDVKIILSLRNPVDRTFSRYVKHKNMGIEEHSFTKLVRRDGKVFDKYTGIGRYSDHVKTYWEYFGKENVLVLIYEDNFPDPIGFIQNIYSFLGVDAFFSPKAAREKVDYQGNLQMRSKTVNTLLNKLNALSTKRYINIIRPYIKPMLKYARRKNTHARGSRDTHRPDIEDKNHLLRFYANDTAELEELLKRDLSHWRA